MVLRLDREALKRGVNRQAILKIWIAEKLKEQSVNE